MLLAQVPAARADALSDARALLAAGQPAEALRRTEAGLAEAPSDPPLRFMKGVLLADAGRRDEATEVFRRLTEDYPELAEPYNNLATLQAESGRYDEARASLEQALRVNPGYATAHENLGDVYAALAARAYRRALQLDPSDRAAATKLDAVRQAYRHEAGAAPLSGRPAAPASAPRWPALPAPGDPVR